MAVSFFYSSLVCIRLKHNMEAHFMESTGMDGIFFFFLAGILFHFLLLAQVNPNTSLPDLCRASERSKQVSIKERGSLVIYCYFGPSATLNVTAFV